MVLCILEHEDGTPEDTSLEALTLARDVADQAGSGIDAVAFGEGADGVAEAAGEYGAGTVHVAEGEGFDTYAPAARASALAALAGDQAPDAILAPGTDRGHEVLSHLAARLDEPMAANCMTVDAGEDYEVERQRWGGTLIEHARLSGEPKLLTAAANEVGAEPAADGSEAAVESFAPSVDDADRVVSVERIEESEEEGIPLGEARIVVGGGRGVGSAEGFDKLEELADLLGAAIGSSRAAVNEGWRSHDDQIGQTGAKIAPKLYIPCGISGAVQHMVGAKGSDNILAINTDPEAAIIGHADWAVVGDLHEVVPELNDALREAED